MDNGLTGDLADILKTILSEPINYVPITEQSAKRAFLKSGLQPELVDYMIEFYRITREEVWGGSQKQSKQY